MDTCQKVHTKAILLITLDVCLYGEIRKIILKMFFVNFLYLELWNSSFSLAHFSHLLLNKSILMLLNAYNKGFSIHRIYFKNKTLSWGSQNVFSKYLITFIAKDKQKWLYFTNYFFLSFANGIDSCNFQEICNVSYGA